MARADISDEELLLKKRARRRLMGAIALASFVAGLFFFRYWRSTRDSFFLYFALSFWIEAANRVALEACVKARNEGVAVEKEGKTVLLEAAEHSPELRIAMETGKEIKFEFDTVDKLDIAHR